MRRRTRPAGRHRCRFVLHRGQPSRRVERTHPERLYMGAVGLKDSQHFVAHECFHERHDSMPRETSFDLRAFFNIFRTKSRELSPRFFPPAPSPGEFSPHLFSIAKNPGELSPSSKTSAPACVSSMPCPKIAAATPLRPSAPSKNLRGNPGELSPRTNIFRANAGERSPGLPRSFSKRASTSPYSLPLSLLHAESSPLLFSLS